jgi:hypothetical protein
MNDTPQQSAGQGSRWEGYSHKDLYTMLFDGPGAAASAEPSRRWAEITSTLSDIGQDLQKAIDLTGAGWSGAAAGAAYARLKTTADWATTTSASAGNMRTSVEDQAGHIAKARAEMPKPEDVPAAAPDPAVAPAVTVLQTQTDAEAAEAAASSAQERAVEVMKAYETSTQATTTLLPTFHRPEPLLPRTDLHGNGGGLLGNLVTGVAGMFGMGSRRGDDRHDERGRGGNHGNQGYRGDTHNASSPWSDTRRRPNLPAPGRTMGVSNDPYFGLPGGGGGGRPQESTPRKGNVVGANPGGSGGGGGGAPGTGPKSGSMGLPSHELQQAQQAAAAGQAAAGTHPGAGAPLPPGAAGPMGAQEKMAMRRFGMDAIGSSQWFGDADEPVPGSAPKRRFDLRQSEEEVIESVTILDEEHQLPPNVIGEGGR